jgi:hypothetical protein
LVFLHVPSSFLFEYEGSKKWFNNVFKHSCERLVWQSTPEWYALHFPSFLFEYEVEGEGDGEEFWLLLIEQEGDKHSIWWWWLCLHRWIFRAWLWWLKWNTCKQLNETYANS